MTEITDERAELINDYQEKLARVSAPVSNSVEASSINRSALDNLYDYSMMGQSSLMREQMLDDAFVIDGIAILGQWTTFYAAPNTGKTLITLQQISQAVANFCIDGEGVFYINADDNFRGLVDKLEIAEEFGFHMLAPNQNGFRATDAIELIRSLSLSEDALGTVIILDTLKKFTDLMDKKKASEFGQIARDFVSAGGTIIALAHTNKHKSADGKSVFAGTSDIRDDSDCVYIIEQVTMGDGETVIEFINDKSRGDVDDAIGFSYKRAKGQTYRHLFDSVVRLQPGSAQARRGQVEVERQLDADSDVIESVIEAIEAGHALKSEIVKYANQQTGIPQRAIKDVLDRRDGALYDLGHRWQSTRGEHNRHRYSLLAPTPSK